MAENPIHKLIVDWKYPADWKLPVNRDPDLMILGDIHCRDDQPACRTDDYVETQIATYKWLRNLWVHYGHPTVLQPGDVFDKWKCSPYTIYMAMRYLPPMVTLAGNPGKHNYHVQGELDHDPLGVVKEADVGWEVLTEFETCSIHKKKLIVIHSCPWGSDPEMWYVDTNPAVFNILLTHRSVVSGPNPFEGDQAQDLLAKYPMYDLIVTGHNHHPILVSDSNSPADRMLFNLGSLIGQSADETHIPSVVLYWVAERQWFIIPVPYDPYAISSEHIDQTKSTTDRKVAFVESLNTHTLEITASFKTNMELTLSTGDVRGGVKIRIQEAMSYEK